MAPRVPTAEEQGLGRIGLDPISTEPRRAVAPAGAFGATTGRQLKQLGDGLAVAGALAERVHEVDVQNRLLETQEKSTVYAAEQKALWSAERTRGNARNLMQDTQTEFKAFEDRVKQEAGYDQLRGSDQIAFDEHIRRVRGGMLANAATFEADETNLYNQELLGARAADAASAMAENYFDVGQVEEGAVVVESTIRELNKGDAKEVVDRKVQAAHTVAYTQVIEAYLQAQNYKGAQAVLDIAVAKDRILPEKLDELDAAVQNGSQVAQVYTETDKIRALHPTDYDAQRKAASAMPAEIRKDVEAEIDRQFKRDQAVRDENTYQVTDGATSDIVNGARTVEQLTTTERTILGVKGVASLQAFEDKQTLRGNGFKLTVDAEAAAENATLQDMATTEVGREKLRTLPLGLYMNKLTEAQWNRWSSYQRSLNSADTQLQQRALSELHKTAPHTAMFKVLKRMYPLLDKGKSQEQIDLNNRITAAAERYVEDTILATGKPPTQTEMTSEGARMVLEVTGDTAPEAWIGGTFAALAAEKPTLTPEQIAVARVAIDDLPISLRDDITRRIKQEGLEATDDLVEQLAGAYALQDRVRMNNLLGRGD